jgi:hypothetical protein
MIFIKRFWIHWNSDQREWHGLDFEQRKLNLKQHTETIGSNQQQLPFFTNKFKHKLKPTHRNIEFQAYFQRLGNLIFVSWCLMSYMWNIVEPSSRCHTLRNNLASVLRLAIPSSAAGLLLRVSYSPPETYHPSGGNANLTGLSGVF